MAQHDQVHEVKLEQLRQEIKLGLNSGDASTWDAASFKQQARQRQQAGNKPA
jgi:Arc/MetJ-type ribon-helix-helix transcriptional regulator